VVVALVVLALCSPTQEHETRSILTQDETLHTWNSFQDETLHT